MKYLIVGSSSGLGRALAEELAASGHDLILTASDDRDLQVQSADLILRYRCAIEHIACHIQPHEPWLKALEKAVGASGELDGIFFPLGCTNDRDRADLAPELVDELIETNFSAVVKIISFCLRDFLTKDKGIIVGFGSVASVRGRGSNVVYAATKRALFSYFESLRHAVSGTNIRVQFYQLGYLDTPRTFGKRLPFPKADITKTAKHIVENLHRDFGCAYFPRYWFIILRVVRWLPWCIYKRLIF